MSLPVFTTKITSYQSQDQGIVVFKASIIVGLVPVYTEYYTNDTKENNWAVIEGVARTSTHFGVYDTLEAEAYLFVRFGKFLQERWSQS